MEFDCSDIDLQFNVQWFSEMQRYSRDIMS